MSADAQRPIRRITRKTSAPEVFEPPDALRSKPMSPLAGETQLVPFVADTGAKRATKRKSASSSSATAPPEQNLRDRLHKDLAEMPINKFSMDEPLPPGTLFAAIGKMRSTINAYTAKMSEATWLAEFSIPTVDAVRGRFVKHRTEIEGKGHVDLEIAFHQLVNRISCVISVARVLLRWGGTQRDEALESLEPFLPPLRAFMKATSSDFAPNLSAVFMFGGFRRMFKMTGSVAEGMGLVDFECLKKCYELYMHTTRIEAPAASEGDEANTAGDDMTKHQKRVQRAIEQGRFLEKRVNRPPLDQFSKLIAEALVSLMFLQPERLCDFQPELVTFLMELQMIRTEWMNKTGCAEDDPFATILAAVHSLFGVWQADESKRGSVEEVRAAHFLVTNAAKGDGADSDVAKAIRTYPLGRGVLEAALDHSRAGVADEASANMFYAATERFEDLVEAPLGSHKEWLNIGDGGKPMSYTSVVPILAELKSMSAAFFGSIGRWSAAALADHKGSLRSTLSNLVAVISLINLVFVKQVGSVFGRCSQLGKLGKSTTTATEDSGGSSPHDADISGDGDLATTLALVPLSAQEAATMPPPAPLTQTFVELGEAAAELNAEQKAFNDEVKIILDGLDKCASLFVARVAPEPDDDVDFASLSKTLDATFTSNAQAAAMMCDYLSAFANIAMDMSDTPRIMQSLALSGTPLNDAFCEFCRIHHQHTTSSPLKFVVAEGLLHDDCVQQANDFFATLAGGFCNDVYNKLAVGSVDFAVNFILDRCIMPNIVHESIVKDCDLAKLPNLLIAHPAVSDLSEVSDLDWKGDRFDEDRFADFPHNLAYRFLALFVDLVGLDDLPFPGANDCERVAAADAIAILEAMCCTRDITIAAIAVHQHLFQLVGKDQTPSQSMLCGPIAFATCQLQKLLTTADSILNSDAALKVEEKGYKLKCSIANARAFQKLMSLLCGRAINEILAQISHILSTAADTCRASTPSWSACFEDGHILDHMVKKLLTDKITKVVDSHNVVHACMKGMCTAASRLSISPRLQDNDMTKSSVRLALDAQRGAAQAAVVIMGMDLRGKYDPKGAEEAQAFLSKYKSPDNMCIPTCFWEELEHVAAHKFTAGATSSVAASPASKKAPSCKSGNSSKSAADHDATPSPLKRADGSPPPTVAFKRVRRA